jgi:hypothetical protein
MLVQALRGMSGHGRDDSEFPASDEMVFPITSQACSQEWADVPNEPVLRIYIRLPVVTNRAVEHITRTTYIAAIESSPVGSSLSHDWRRKSPLSRLVDKQRASFPRRL